MDCADNMLLQGQGHEYQTPLAAAVQAAQGNDPADPVAQALTQEVSLYLGNSITQFGKTQACHYG